VGGERSMCGKCSMNKYILNVHYICISNKQTNMKTNEVCKIATFGKYMNSKS
jgi:hypothetical protein